MSDTAPASPVLGWIGFFAGAGALVLAIVTLAAGPFAPQQPAGVGLGELAADIAKSAARAVAGRPQPEPVAPVRDIDDWLRVAVGALSGLAVILGAAALLRGEAMRAAAPAIALGLLAAGFQLFTWTVMMVVGALVLMALIYALRDAFGDIFGGLFGG
ncbi:hypothetical protein ACQ5SO_13140 [Rhodovulum sp. DZ06]|uniref:hypothetical protein n=1 Tax=Rhodovulum sp. DZ06 TaxID=3425126 RepID=UPI003D3377AC